MPKRCDRCRQAMGAGQTFYIRGAEICVCGNCSRDGFSYCPECGNFYCHEDMLITGNNKRVCFWCAAEKYYICPRCRTLTPNENKVKYHGYSICRSCSEKKFYRCENCNGSFEAGMMAKDLKHCIGCEKTLPVKCNICKEVLYKRNAKIFDGLAYCSTCYERYSRKCQDCGKVFPGDKLYYRSGKKRKVVCLSCLCEADLKAGNYVDYLENCFSCGKPLVTPGCFMMDGVPYCPECRDEELQRCEVCGKYTFKEFIRKGDAAGTLICPTCNLKYTAHHNSGKQSAKAKRFETDDDENGSSSVFNDTLSTRLLGGAAVLGMMGVFDKPDSGDFTGDSRLRSFCPECMDFCEDAECVDDFCDCDTHQH